MDTAKQLAAWLPIALSIAMIGMLACALFILHPAPAADEGTMAHLFQLWLVFEIAAIPYFALTRMRDKATALIALTQLVFAAIPVGIVFSLHL